MKKSFLVLSFLMLSAAASVFAQEGLKIAYVNSDSVVRSLPEFKTKSKELESYGKQLQAQLQSKSKEYETKLAELKANYNTWIPDVIEDKTLELQQLEASIQQFTQKSQQNLQKKEQDAMGPIYEKVQEGIEAVAKEQDLDFVVQQQLFIFAKPQFDITTAVITKVGGVPE